MSFLSFHTPDTSTNHQISRVSVLYSMLLFPPMIVEMPMDKVLDPNSSGTNISTLLSFAAEANRKNVFAFLMSNVGIKPDR